MQFLLALLLIPSATVPDVGLCARIGAQSLSPASVSRHVRYQLCTADNLPLTRVERITLHVEPLTADHEPAIVAATLATDTLGRFEVTYGAGTASRELHVFSLDGHVIATFLVERGARTVDVLRKNMQDPEGGATYP